MFAEKELSDIYEKGAFTLLEVVKPLAQGKGFIKELEPRPSQSFALDVIPGDPGMSLQEDTLATDWVQATGGDIRGLRTTFLFSDLLSRCDDYDYVFFDMGPSLGSINRAVLIAADFFLTPMSTDIFSLRAVDNISASLTSWKKRLERALEDIGDNITELEVESPDWKLQFLGFLQQQYTAKAIRGKKQPVRAFEKIARQIPKRINAKLIQPFTKRDIAAAQFDLGSIPTLHSLIPLSQTGHTPIFALKGSHGVVGAHFTKVREYHEIIEGIADRFDSQIGALS